MLFHLSQVWVDGKQLGPTRTKERIRPGTRLSFYDQTLEGEEYKALSSEGILHQALVVWSGERPDHLMKNIDSLGHSYVEELVNQRKVFMVYVNGQVFLPCDLVRVKGVVRGYISPRLGIIECNVNRDRVNVFFHVEAGLAVCPFKIRDQLILQQGTQIASPVRRTSSSSESL